ncbi:MerR family transcriptional regulator [Litorimonas haliclonae]|uniref:MerR family transcriptional regulator n=1 Tax=Litorimonas haliclonae TaxID=2081977 RepID=UPI0039F09F60
MQAKTTQAKTTRAFRTISEAGEELDLQPHVLRFWESKFSQIKPIKRGGGRRFYRPEDIEFLRGIKILLHDEGHPIKDVQKLIRLKGPGRVLELGQSVQKASRERKVEETVLVPERIQKVSQSEPGMPVAPASEEVVQPPVTRPTEEVVVSHDVPDITPKVVASAPQAPTLSEGEIAQRRQDFEEALERLQSLKARWAPFLKSAS